MELTNRIEVDPNVRSGKPVVKGTRIPVYIILQMIENGSSFEEIIETYPDLERKDIRACLN